MEMPWKATNFLLGLLLINICTGFPINLEASPEAFRSQFLAGLIGVLLTVCGVVCLVGCLCCQRHHGFKEFHNAPVLASSSSSLDHGLTNPITNREFTIFTPLSSPQQNNIFLAHEQLVQHDINSNEAEVDIHSWFDQTEIDFPRTKLKYIREYGKGWFGRVVEGTAQGITGDEHTWTPVAVRILEATATIAERSVFLHDARIYRHGLHPHILQLLGRNFQSIPLLLLQELCSKGDLKKYLLENQRTPEKILNSELPLRWCCQLSSAMKHLHDNHLTHPDLGTRNCQITSELSLKLGDYGIAASLYPDDYYQGVPAIPVRWCAPESLTYTSTTIQPKEITCESNVWSLGVTMWEIFECGAQPYAHLSDDEVISHVLSSATVRLSVPRYTLLYTNYIYRLMQLCWSSYELRPPVTQVQLMLSDLMQVYQNTKDLTSTEPLISMQDFDKRWSTFKSNSIARTDNHHFNLDENKSEMDIDINDISVLNFKLDKNMKEMSPSLNNLHGSLDNLTGSEMDSWLQNLATKTGDILYVRGLSEAFNDLDNTLAMENVSSSDSSYLPSPAPESFSNFVNKLEFKLGPTENHVNFMNELDKTQHSSFTESTQRTSSESDTEDETWRRKVEQGAYSEKVHQKSKSVTDLMILTHIDQSESESETPLPSLDYRVNYKNVRYAPMQNLESVSLLYGSEGNLLSVHDKFQEELKRLQEERKDSLLFVPESSISDYKSEEFSDTSCTTIAPSNLLEEQTSYSVNTSPSHHNPELLIEELSSPRKIQPESQIYNIFNVSVDTSFRPNLNNIIFESTEPNCREESPQRYEVPKLVDIIQNNDHLMDYIIARYESQTDLQSSRNEIQTMPEHQVCFDLSLTQDKLLPSSMTHSAICSNSAFALEKDLEFSSDFGNYIQHADEFENKQTELDLTYSLETWNNFLGDTLNEPREYCSDFTSFPSESQASLKECERSSVDNSVCAQTESTENDNLICTNLTRPVYNKMPDLIPITHEEDSIKINNWEPEVGWFLHPQSNSEVSGKLETSQTEEDDVTSYERFNRDNDVMAAIRNELLLKLPQAQGHTSESVRDYEECDTEERNEIHIKYNVYTTPLSPIPEESYSESDACYYVCNKDDSSDTESDDEWPAPFEEEINPDMTNLETQSIHNVDSLDQGNQNPHTPSQDSCCSNDTLFNLEELTCGINEIESIKERNGSEADKILKDNSEKTKTDYSVIEKYRKETNEDINTDIKNIYEIQILFAETMANSIIVNHLNEHVSINCSETFLVNNHNYSNIHDKNTNAILHINTLELATIKSEAKLLEVGNKITSHLDLFTNENEDFLAKSCDCSKHVCNPVSCTYLKNGDRQMKEEINRCLSERNSINGIKLTVIGHNDQSNNSGTNKYMLYKEANRSDINQNDKITFDWELTNKTIVNSPHIYIYVNDKNSYNFDKNLDNKTLIENAEGCKHLDENIKSLDNSDMVTTLNFKNIKNTIDINEISQKHVVDSKFSHSEFETGNLHYIAEFLDYERKNVDSYNKASLIADNNYTNINDKKINMIGKLQPQYANIVHEEHLYDVVEHDIYDVLTDIRFSGPGDIQLMSTSFSESVDVDEQDWDSGSDTRSSSSGEFIWKEGEHEESVKALRAAPQDENILERAEPLDDIKEINSESSDDEDDDEDMDSPEFVPSAWDKYATPSKSALRSPEKTLERSEVKQTKPKGVWFKKQKYHCVYEYPKEPDSPVINHFELWQPVSNSMLDWEVDTSPYIPHYDQSNYSEYDLNSRETDNIYQINKSNTEFSTMDDEFYISSTARPFEAFSGLSQFFPGASEQWVDLTKNNDNITPDSGIEDAMSLSEVSQQYKVPSLKTLSAMALKQNHVNVIKNNNAALGGLRHARNKLKLDLPPSPSAFSYTKAFTLEPPEEPITRCEIPTFTTFGKSRFLVQQVDTLSNSDENGCKNVSFEALPYKPLKTDKSKVEVVRGEASLLDSADEDSGIESSTFDRRSVEN